MGEDEAADVPLVAVVETVVEVGEEDANEVVGVPLELLGVGVGAGVDVGVLPVDVCEPPEPVWLPCPASGSVYWLSPAEGPEAIAAAGTERTSAAKTNSQVKVTRQERTPRVLQPMRLPAFSDLHRPDGTFIEL